jgi:hypothetical protein
MPSVKVPDPLSALAPEGQSFSGGHGGLGWQPAHVVELADPGMVAPCAGAGPSGSPPGPPPRDRVDLDDYAERQACPRRVRAGVFDHVTHHTGFQP